jgi:hypothetical protein
MPCAYKLYTIVPFSIRDNIWPHSQKLNACTFLYCIRNTLLITHRAHCGHVFKEKIRGFSKFFCTTCIFSLVASEFILCHTFSDRKISFTITGSSPSKACHVYYMLSIKQLVKTSGPFMVTRWYITHRIQISMLHFNYMPLCQQKVVEINCLLHTCTLLLAATYQCIQI